MNKVGIKLKLLGQTSGILVYIHTLEELKERAMQYFYMDGVELLDQSGNLIYSLPKNGQIISVKSLNPIKNKKII